MEPVSIADEVPFEIPDSWMWVRHNSFFEISGGSQPPKEKFISNPKDGYIRLYQIRDYGKSPVPVYIPESTATKRTKKGDILLARYGASLGKVFYAEDGAYNVAMAKVIPLFTGNWIFNCLFNNPARFIFIRNYLNHIIKGAIQYPANLFQCFQRNGFVFSELSKGIGS